MSFMETDEERKAYERLLEKGKKEIEQIHDYETVSDILKPDMKGRKERIDGTAPKNIDQENKPKPSLIPWDIILEFDEPPYREGLLKYYRESWRKGFKVSDMFDACQRHLIKFYYHKEDYDQETWEKYKIKKHHIGAARFCLACICQTLKEHPELDDRRTIHD